MDKKLLAVDLDGTLVDGDTISVRDKKFIEEVNEADVPVVPATTRMRFSAARLLKGLEITHHPIICHNGARVVGPGWDDENRYEDWTNNRLEPDTAAKIVHFADENDYELTTVFSEKKYWQERRYERTDPAKRNPITHVVNDNEEVLNYGDPINFMMHREGNGVSGLEKMEYFLRSELKKNVKTHRHHRGDKWTALTAYPVKTSKARGLELVSERLDIPMKSIVAVGDDEVDIEMIKSVGLGIAMENSPQHVKDAADLIAPSCSDNGVGWVIENHLL